MNDGGRLPERTPSNRLRFESNVEGITSGQFGPKSTPGISQKDRYKRRAQSENNPNPHSLPPTDTPQAPGNPYSRLRFESEAGPGSLIFNEDTPATSGHVGPKSTDTLTPQAKGKRRLMFEEDTPPESALIQDNPKSRLRFENEAGPDNSPFMQDTPDASSLPANPKQKVRFNSEVDPNPHSLPLPPHKAKQRLQFEDEEAPDGLPPTDSTPATSGQNGPKLKQQSQYKQGDKNSVQSENLRPDADSPLRHDDESPAFHQDSDTPPGGTGTGGGTSSISNSGNSSGGSSPKGKTAAQSNPQAKKQAAKHKNKMDKAEAKVDKTGEKLDKAKEKLAAQKPPTKPGLVKQLGNKAKFMTWAYVHKKIYQVEHENVGTESAHKTELTAEGIYRGAKRFIKHRIRTRPKRRVQKLTKRNARARADHAYQKLLQDNPELRKKALARFYHKQRLKMRYAKQARQTAHGVKHGGGIITKTADKLKNIAVALIKKNPKVWLIIFLGFMLIFLLQSCMSMFSSIGSGIGGVVVGTSYLAEDENIDDATVLYTEWETDFHYRIINAERDNPGFDEYRFNIGDISHNPFELIAFLTAVYNDFTLAEVQATMQEIFNEQYNLTFTPEVEIRTRTETRTGSYTWTDSEGNRHTETYTYTVEVEYEWFILNVNLTAQSFTSVIYSRMDEEQLQRFNILMVTKGNRQYLQSPFGDMNWLPFVTSYYGWRIHPISGARERHWGLDIGLPEGTEILSGQDGTVIFAENSGGYGLLVVIDDGEGLVSRYAHCSVLYVSVGDIVSAGDLIARVGSTGDSTGPHLHLEIIKNGRHLNPLIFTVTNDWNEGPTFGDPGASMGDGSLAALIAEAERHLGKPYIFGANGPNAFDCSSFVAWVFTHSGVYNLPRTNAQGIFNRATPISPSEARPGDIITFTGTYSTTNPVSHIGIYVGNGMMIHAGSPVQYTSINSPYWQRHFYSFARLPSN